MFRRIILIKKQPLYLMVVQKNNYIILKIQNYFIVKLMCFYFIN
jgi:hypothetical protein